MSLLAKTTSFAQDGSSAAYSQRDRAQSLNRDVSYHIAPQITAGYKAATIDLRVVETVNRFNGIDLKHRSYNGGLVGPTICVWPGQTLKVRLQNDLDAEPDYQHSANVPHGFNTTNLHTHGLHVSPRQPADDVFLEIKPKTHFNFQFEIARDHPPGTFWYHAHKHGSTGLQLASGMSGALIVRGGLDEIPEIKRAKEQIMVLQQFMYKEVGSDPAYVDPDLLYMNKGEIIEAINGVVTPTITMQPGEIQRWRIIHAGTTEAIFLNAAGVNFYQIAVDGLATGRKELKNSLQLYPGYRSDVLVEAPLNEGPRLMYSQIRDPEKAIQGKEADRRNLLRIVVKGDPVTMKLPSDASLIRAAEALDQDDVPTDAEVVKRRTLRFSGEDDQFHIDGAPFDPSHISQSIELGAVEEWELISDRGAHPFHIHVNPFAIKPLAEGDPWVWRDTFVLQRNKPVTIRIRFREHDGKTVLHCHNLVHEDQGMMQAIEIVRRESPQADEERRTAPAWTASERSGRRHSDSQYRGRPRMIVFHRGMECVHCVEQMRTLKKDLPKLRAAGVELVAISQYLPEEEAVARQLAEFPFPILIDPELESFRNYACLNEQGAAMHGIFLIDSDNRVLLAHRTEIAVADPTRLVLDVLNRHREGD